MEIRLLCDRVVSGGGYQPAGEIIDVPKSEAKRLVAVGSAEYVTGRAVTEIETAVDMPQGVEAAVVTYQTKTKKRRLS